MLDKVRRRLSRSSKSESFVPTLDPDQHGHRPSISRTTTISPGQPNHNLSRLSLSPSDRELIKKLTFDPDQPLVERARRNRTPSLNTIRWSERTVFNNTTSGILSLPAEVLLYMQQYLSLCSEVSLRQSCFRFFDLYSSPSFYLSGDDQFDFICMIERDQDPTLLRRLVCGRCRELHPKIAFPSSDVRRAPLDRDCRQVWLCPHTSLGYEKTIRKIKAGVESPFRAENIDPCNKCRERVRNRAVADRPEKGTAAIDLENPRAESLLITKMALLQAPSPSHNTRGTASGLYTETFRAKDVSDALQALNFPICPHIRLGDPFTLTKFCRACTSTTVLPPGTKGPVCISQRDKDVFGRARGGKCKGQCYTPGCRTRFMFQARESLAPDASGKRQVWLIFVVYRWLGPLLQSGKDSTWLDHAVNTHERIDMRNAWEQWSRLNRDRPCMPNWSICLLHPEDCNLRQTTADPSTSSVRQAAGRNELNENLKGLLENLRRN